MTKPKFDPHAPFEVGTSTIASKPKFNPELPFDVSTDVTMRSDVASPIESGVRKFVQGGSLGLSDEIAGAVEGLGRTVGVEGLGGPMKDVSISKGGPTLDWEILKDAYVRARDKEREALQKDSKDNPKISAVSELAGAFVSPANKVLKGASLAKGGALLGGATGLGYSDSDSLKGLAADTIAGSVVGAGTGKVLEKAAPLLGKAAQSLASKFSGIAEKSAVNATGATGKQASQFSDTAGRELLDRGIVRFGDSQAKISERAAKAVDQANRQIDDALTALESKGVKVDANKVYEEIQKKIVKLKSDPSQADVVRMLEGEAENLINATVAKGSAEFGVKEAEQIKRGYNRKAGNWADPEKGLVGKEMYQTYRGAVEDVALKADPGTAKVFTEGKKSYGLLTPIQEAAERRAATTSQHPAGGFLDIASILAGGAQAGPAGAVAAPIARRFVAPRISSSIAASADGVAKILRKIPNAAVLEKEQPRAFQALVKQLVGSSENPTPLPKAADKEEPSQGPEKWANEGLKRLEAHASGSVKRDALQSLKETKRGRDLLVKASTLKPGSMAMENVMANISNLGKAK